MRDTLVPPAELEYGTGMHQFQAIAREYADHCRRLAGLTPDGHVLDVGCGFGSLAVGLLDYLSPAGRYEGFDVVPTGVRWATDAITPRHPNFRFRLVDVFNQTYHPAGLTDPCGFRFPYPDDAFDVVQLRSVFTHMRPDGVSHYLSEIKRVLKPTGRAVVTYFLLNAESERLMDTGHSVRGFPHDCGGYRQNEPGEGGTIAYPEEYVHELYARHGLAIVGPVHYGRWCGRPAGASSQDLIVAAKGGVT